MIYRALNSRHSHRVHKLMKYSSRLAATSRRFSYLRATCALMGWVWPATLPIILHGWWIIGTLGTMPP